MVVQVEVGEFERQESGAKIKKMEPEDGRTTTTTTMESRRDDAEADVDVDDTADDGAEGRRILNDGVEDFAGIRDDEEETPMTRESNRGDDDAEDGVGGFDHYVDDVFLRIDDRAPLQEIFDAARRFQNIINERLRLIRSRRTPPEADEE